MEIYVRLNPERAATFAYYLRQRYGKSRKVALSTLLKLAAEEVVKQYIGQELHATITLKSEPLDEARDVRQAIKNWYEEQ